jgi:hypothetical protein
MRRAAGQRRAEAVQQQIVVMAKQENRHVGAGYDEQRQIGVGHSEEAAEKDGLHLMHVELAGDRHEQAQAESQRQRQEDADQRIRRQRRSTLGVHHPQRRKQAETHKAPRTARSAVLPEGGRSTRR